MSDDQTRAIFLANGFTIKEGQDDLKPYVYEAALRLIDTYERTEVYERIRVWRELLDRMHSRAMKAEEQLAVQKGAQE